MVKSLRHYQWLLRLMGWFKIPLIAYVKPRLIVLDDQQVKVSIRLRRRTKNHLNSMYFGALAVGADVAAGMHVFYFCDQFKVQPAFAFKSMKAEFLKRAESNVTFRCEEGELIRQMVEAAIDSKERQNRMVQVKAFDLQHEMVASFEMEVSLKVK
jgi:acyl-coenzyme A thioesterase PaaI-like protein